MSALRAIARQPAAYLFATFATLRTAMRLTRMEKRHRFDELVVHLRRDSPLPGPFRDPMVYGRVANRLAHYLPPRRMGYCIKRSLWLVNLWTRCGLEPKIHIGLQRTGPNLQGHAWLTLEGQSGAAFDLEPLLGTPEPGYPDFFAF
ncbi:MAG: lasso peptide biosynthesis B2 protein [Acidobacteriota bacterium]|nr:lasso peptide biosynthesis B2 protein [Acidobacteriota bacterium]